MDQRFVRGGGGGEFGDDLLGLCQNRLKLTYVQPVDWIFVLVSQIGLEGKDSFPELTQNIISLIYACKLL